MDDGPWLMDDGSWTRRVPGVVDSCGGRFAHGPEMIDSMPDGSIVVDGMAALRTLNRKLGTHFPLDGPKTLNGLIVEQLGEIPDAGIQVAVAGQKLEILQTQDRAVKVVRLLPPVGRTTATPPLQSQGGQASSVA